MLFVIFDNFNEIKNKKIAHCIQEPSKWWSCADCGDGDHGNSTTPGVNLLFASVLT